MKRTDIKKEMFGLKKNIASKHARIHVSYGLIRFGKWRPIITKARFSLFVVLFSF
jgi:hypothetical protein